MHPAPRRGSTSRRRFGRATRAEHNGSTRRFTSRRIQNNLADKLPFSLASCSGMSEARTAELPTAIKAVPLTATALWRKPSRRQALPVFAILALLFIAFLSLVLPQG